MMDFIYQKIDKILRTYGDTQHVALADVYLAYGDRFEAAYELRGLLLSEARALAAEHGSDDEYDDMVAISYWVEEVN